MILVLWFINYSVSKNKALIIWCNLTWWCLLHEVCKLSQTSLALCPSRRPILSVGSNMAPLSVFFGHYQFYPASSHSPISQHLLSSSQELSVTIPSPFHFVEGQPVLYRARNYMQMPWPLQGGIHQLFPSLWGLLSLPYNYISLLTLNKHLFFDFLTSFQFSTTNLHSLLHITNGTHKICFSLCLITLIQYTSGISSVSFLHVYIHDLTKCNHLSKFNCCIIS